MKLQLNFSNNSITSTNTDRSSDRVFIYIIEVRMYNSTIIYLIIRDNVEALRLYADY